MTFYPPGSTLGIMGAGQLARMTAREAARLGYRVKAYSPDPTPCADATCNQTFVGGWGDTDKLELFLDGVDVVTYELEGLPLETAEWLANRRPLRPGKQLLEIAQDRRRERAWLEDNVAGPSWAPVETKQELEQAVQSVGAPGFLKRAFGGYDGRGQVRIESAAEAGEAWKQLDESPCVLERQVDYLSELSVIGARAQNGEVALYGPITNVHVDGILDHSIFPAAVPDASAKMAREMASAILEGLDVIGVIGVEMFLTVDGTILVNELAPRPHNSGHLTIETHATSQFEQHARTVLGLPIGSCEPRFPGSAMVNLLGDLWSGGEPHWLPVFEEPQSRLHLYEKEPRPARKVGHITTVSEGPDTALDIALGLRAQLATDL